MKTEAEIREEILAANPDIAATPLEDEIQRCLIDQGGPPVASDEIPAGLRGRVKFPEDARGHYVVLWAPKPKRGAGRPGYVEVACVPAQDSDHAKRIVLEDDGRAKKPVAERGEVARWLIARAEADAILLRAVPAAYWPRDVKPTGMERPEPVLTIG